ncbi:MAG: YhbY family RNA-binding protein [Candidatus Woesearchaeota archaeon]|jgi:RNA-binding protein
MDHDQYLELKKKAHTLPHLVRIGKAGLSQTVIEEIIKQIKVHHLVKIKFLKNFMDDTPKTKREIGDELATKTNSTLIALVGNTVVLYK